MAITYKQKKKLESMSRLGKMVRFKSKETGESRLWGKVEDEVYILVHDYKHMIQRISPHPEGSTWWDGSKYGYRTGYYTFAKGKKSIVWGQYSQFLTGNEYRRLHRKAVKKGWRIE